MTFPIESSSQPLLGVQKSSNGKDSSFQVSSLDKTAPPTNFATFKKALKRGLTVAFLPFVLGYKMLSKSLADRRFIQDHVLPKLEKAIMEAKKNNQPTTEPLFVGSFTLDPVDLAKTEGLSLRQILVNTLGEMKRNNEARLDVYRKKIKGYIHADFSVLDDKGNATPLDPATKKIFLGIEQSALKKIKLHNQKSQQEGRPEASKAEELVIVQNCIKDEIRTLSALIENSKKTNFEDESNEKIKALEARLVLLNDYSDAIKAYNTHKIIETKIEGELEKCALTPVKDFFKALGITLTTLYFGVIWIPFIPVFALIGLSNAAFIAGTGRDLTGRKHEEIEKKNQLALLAQAQSKDEPPSTLRPALVTKPTSAALIPVKIPSKITQTDETIAAKQQEERTLEELEKIIDRVQAEINDLEAQEALDKIIESLRDLELRSERPKKKNDPESANPYEFIDELIEKIDKGFTASP